MTPPPVHPKVYHITHLDNLPRIQMDGHLLSDAAMIARGGPTRAIGMSEIKRRRVEELEVPCHPGTKVGDFVPFYFCPRSVMLYVIYRGNHPDLEYRGEQDEIVHLEANLQRVIDWAQANSVRWAFSLSNAGARYAEFRSRTEELEQLNWTAISATDFRNQETKEGKQAEFLLHGNCLFSLIETIGVRTPEVSVRVDTALAGSNHQPVVEVVPEWYF